MPHTIPRLLLLTASTSAACEPVLTRDVGVEGLFRGYVYDDYTYIGDYAVLPDASLSARDASGEPTGEVEASSDRPGYFEITVDPKQPVELVVAAPGRLTTVRATLGPATLADFSPYIFPRASEVITPLIDELSGQLGTPDSTGLLAGEVGALWMEPLVPADWAGADIYLDSGGAEVEFIALTVLDDGAVALAEDGPLDRLVAPALPPGRLTLLVATATGDIIQQSWNVQAGELVDASWFNLPQ